MRKLGWAWVFLGLLGCDEQEGTTPATLDRSLLDSSVARGRIDSGQSQREEPDASTQAPACPTLDVCTGAEQGLLYNVCIGGAPSGGVAQPACLVDPNGVLYLAPLASGQVVLRQGWTQSTDGTLRAADLERCEAARVSLREADAAVPPKCAGSP